MARFPERQPMPVLSLDHVQVAIPVGGEAQARQFYVGILGFTEVEKPPAMAERKSIWLIAGPVNLHLGIEPDFHPAKRAHPALLVADLDEILVACQGAGLATKADISFNGFRRVHVLDPFGNRLELMQRESV
jgi:catechol 2,3-dioxygenase-like lactoylglutathione lyase family enzyme